MYVWLATNRYFSWHKIQVGSCISQNDFPISQYVNISFITGHGKKTFLKNFFERHFASDNKNNFSYAFWTAIFFYCGLSSVQGGGEIMRTQWTQTVLRGACLVITAQLHEALWGPAQGPHPHLTGSPRSDLYDTGDVWIWYEWIYMTSFPLASQGAREPGLGVIVALVTCGACSDHSPEYLAFEVSDSLLPGVSCLPHPHPWTSSEGAGPEVTDTWGSLTALPLALVCSPLIKDYQNIFLKCKPENHHPVLPPSVTPTARGVPSCLPSSPLECQSHHTRRVGVACALPGHLCSLPGQLHPGGHTELCAPWGELDAPLCFPQSPVNPLMATGIPQHLWVPDGGPALCIPRAPPWMVVPPHTPPWPGGLGCGNSSQSPPTLICLTARFIHPSLQDQDVHITPMLWTDLALILMQVSQLHISLYETLGKLECWTFNQMNELQV